MRACGVAPRPAPPGYFRGSAPLKNWPGFRNMARYEMMVSSTPHSLRPRVVAVGLAGRLGETVIFVSGKGWGGAGPSRPLSPGASGRERSRVRYAAGLQQVRARVLNALLSSRKTLTFLVVYLSIILKNKWGVATGQVAQFRLDIPPPVLEPATRRTSTTLLRTRRAVRRVAFLVFVLLFIFPAARRRGSFRPRSPRSAAARREPWRDDSCVLSRMKLRITS